MLSPSRRQPLFGKFSGQSKLKQGDTFIHLTPDTNTGAPISALAPLLPVRELEGAFGVVKGRLEDRVLYEAALVEVIPPILSQVLAGLVEEGTLTAEALLPKVNQSIASLIRVPVPEPSVDADAPLCALVVGHRPAAKGAVSQDGQVTEFEFNLSLTDDIIRAVGGANVTRVLRDDRTDGLMRLPGKINALKPDFIVSMHCNAYHATATGTETLYFKSSGTGHKIAKVFQRHMVGALGLRNRHTKPVTGTERGGILLKNTHAPCIIAEPFFISNDRDLGIALQRRSRLISAYAGAIDEIADTLRR